LAVTKLDFDDITITPLRESDIPAILEIEYDSQPEPWNERAFLEEIDRAHSRLFVARLSERGSSGEEGRRDSGIVAGYICFWKVKDEIQILNVAVRKTLRRRGIARRLIQLAIRTGSGNHARFVTLEVRKSNLAAQSLYESLGFAAVGERPNYYGVQNESAILMQLELETHLNS